MNLSNTSCRQEMDYGPVAFDEVSGPSPDHTCIGSGTSSCRLTCSTWGSVGAAPLTTPQRSRPWKIWRRYRSLVMQAATLRSCEEDCLRKYLAHPLVPWLHYPPAKLSLGPVSCGSGDVHDRSNYLAHFTRKHLLSLLPAAPYPM